jgi:hypothetical protein
MRLPCVKFTINRALLTLAILSAALPALLIERVSPEGWLPWVLAAAGLASPILFLVYVVAEVLTYDPRRGKHGHQAVSNTMPLPRPHFTVLQLMISMAIMAVICWFLVLLVPLWSAAFHRPTDTEMAARFGLDAAHWTQLAAENPPLAKEYLRLAQRYILAAERRERRARRSEP